MFNFREELEYIKKAKDDQYQYAAEEFLRGAFKRLKGMNTKSLKEIETFDVHYSIADKNRVCITAGVNNGISFACYYDLEKGKKVFKKIEDIIGETYYFAMKKEKDVIHVRI